jgi:hypothetical protein
MNRRLFFVIALRLAGAATLGACSFIPGLGNGSSSGRLVYDGAVEYTVPMGQIVPGTNIQYVGHTDEGAQVSINGQMALKKPGDSLDWKGDVAPGVQVSMPQRMVLADENRMQTVGTVRVTITDAAPMPQPFPGGGRYVYKVGSGYTVRKGDTIPGTTLTYLGKTDEGAQFSGIEGYPYRRIGDSVAWQGRLNGSAFLDATYRVVAYTDEVLTLAGLGTIAVQ